MAEKIIKGEGGRELQRKVERNLGRKAALGGENTVTTKHAPLHLMLNIKRYVKFTLVILLRDRSRRRCQKRGLWDKYA